jgi:hypothetical protein
MGWIIGVQFLPGARDFSLLCSIRTDSGAHPAPYPVGTGALLTVVQWQACDADHSLPSSAEVKMVELYLHSPICVHDIVLNYIIKYRDNFTFYLRPVKFYLSDLNDLKMYTPKQYIQYIIN